MNLSSDIVRTILSLSHPYHNKGFIYSHSYIYKIADNYRYHLLRIWCFPFLSIFQIINKYPNVTLGQVIEASLYYYPINESLNYYPKLELLYNACIKGITNIDPFIVHSDDKDENNVCSLILYKFNRIAGYNMWADSFFNILRMLSLGKKPSIFDIQNSCEYPIIFCSFVLSLEETLELLIQLTDSNFYPLIDFGFSLCGNPNIEHLSIAGISMNMILGANRIEAILKRAGRYTQVNTYTENLSQDRLYALEGNETLCPIYSRYINVNSSLYKRAHVDIKDMKEEEVCLHALETGDILSYIVYRDDGYLIPEDYRCWFAPNIIFDS